MPCNPPDTQVALLYEAQVPLHPIPIDRFASGGNSIGLEDTLIPGTVLVGGMP
jgi:hypothetical protein